MDDLQRQALRQAETEIAEACTLIICNLPDATGKLPHDHPLLQASSKLRDAKDWIDGVLKQR